MSEVPLLSAVSGYVRKAPARFHTPGHKGSRNSPLALFGDALAYDVTELPETDSLFDAQGPIRRAEELAAKSCGMRASVFSAGGATLCIQTMFRLVSESGKRRVVCARNIHRSAVNAMALLGLEPIWVWPSGFEGSSLPGEIRPADVVRALDACGDVAAVYLTSPDYYGVISDIAGIAAACKKHDVPLLVDNAHGSHLLYLDGGALHPARQGADLTCDSAHKTLPVLTGGAVLQIATSRFSYASAKDAAALFGSTSPSYLILLSLDMARGWLEQNGIQAFGRLRGIVGRLKKICRQIGYFEPAAAFDPVRLTLDTASVGTGGPKAEQILRECGISPEMHDDSHVVLLPSPFNSDEDFERLENALARIPGKGGETARERSMPAQHPQAVLLPGEAVKSPCVCVETSSAADRIAAEGKCPCPPGIPLIMPGEKITAEYAELLKNYGVGHIKVIK